MDDPLLKSMGDEAVGVYSAHWYTPDHDSESNRRFVAGMQRNYGELPGGYAAGLPWARPKPGQAMPATAVQAKPSRNSRRVMPSPIMSLRCCDASC